MTGRLSRANTALGRSQRGCDDERSALVSVRLCLGNRLRLGSGERVVRMSLQRLFIIKLCICILWLPLHGIAATTLVFDTRGNIIGSYVEGSASSYAKMQSTLSGVYYKKAGDMGYSPVADASGGSKWAPSVTATINGVSAVAGGTAATVAGVLLAGATAPGWVGVAIAAGISTVIGYAVTMAVNGAMNWLFRSDQKIDESSATIVEVDPSNGIASEGTYWAASDAVTILYGGDGPAVARQARYNIQKRGGQTNPASVACTQPDATHWLCGGTQATFAGSGAPGNCAKGSFYTANTSTCSPYVFPQPGAVAPKTGVDLQTAIADLSMADKEKPLNPAIVAAIANQLWKQAAGQPGYAGLPYSYSNAITPGDVSTWQAANPGEYPTVGEFVSPQTGTAPWTMPVSGSPVGASNGTQTQPTGTVNPASSSAQINLGPDPSVGSPQIETTPTAAQILAPILGLMPELRTFNTGTHTAVCPRPTLNLFGETQTMEAHCTLLDGNKTVVQAAMALAWALLALLIILSA